MKKVIGIVIGMMILLPIGIQAEEENDTTKVVISFDLTAEDRFTYEVKVSEGGYLYDGSQRITNGIVAYELSVGQRKEFRIEVERGYEVKEIKVNEENLNINIQEIEIAGVSANSILEVRYGRIEEEPDITDPPEVPEQPVQPEEPNDSNGQGNINKPEDIGKIHKDNVSEKENGVSSLIPITGDMLRISEYVCLMLIILYRLYVSRRGIDTIERVDNIAISGDIEKKQKTLKEEKEDER